MSSKPEVPRGFRDFPPEVMELRLKVINTVRNIFEINDFPPMDTPSIEYWETLAGKYGPEAENKLIWRFKDPFSEKEYALRYDLTVPLARYVASHPELQLPFKRHQISYVWRHEEPQRGRYREFLQADIDTVGSKFVESDAEIINTMNLVLEELGLDDFIVKINHRKILYIIFEKRLGSNVTSVLRAIDKLDKIGIDGVILELQKIGLDESSINWIINLISNRDSIDNLENIKKNLVEFDFSLEDPLNELIEFREFLAHRKHIVFDLSLVRGLDYYTGIIFEISLEKGSPGSIAGGGRYDNLIKMFKGSDLPATGGSLGIERIFDVLEERNITSKFKKKNKVFIITLNEDSYKYAWNFSYELRTRGIKTEIDLMRRNVDKQKKKGASENILFHVYIGKKEKEGRYITIVERDTGKRLELPYDKAIDYILIQLKER
ncbi:histidine--tRNA ligase [Fervidicoccus fontis]|uniref:Histidine--tRNA ligase n=1 Tax=Fervidicoccus fontis TaxID=683846 RepID=A0A2J6N2Q9_9CREN|nr:histidine--tRNA ligase [Fervidicoccus fontis]PMB75526.1 MAG: histidine--tRNA ligase [Fervidicoccus fontis]HEW64494.1 histidine--tRNA ligase [Fervidicoccus fontis]